jgi:hypothetical protein
MASGLSLSTSKTKAKTRQLAAAAGADWVELQVRFKRSEFERLSAIAEDRGEPKNLLIRRIVREWLATEEARQRA